MSVIDNNKYAQYRLILKNFPNCLSPSRNYTRLFWLLDFCNISMSVKFFAPNFPSALGVKVYGDAEIMTIIKKHQEKFTEMCGKSGTVLEFMINLKQFLKQIERENNYDKKAASDINLERDLAILSQINSVGFDKVTDISLNLLNVEFSFLDDNSQEHKLQLIIPEDFPRSEVYTSTNLPDEWQPKSTKTFLDIYTEWLECIESYIPAWKELADLDKFCWVLDPDPPTPGDMYRRLAAGPCLSVQVEVDAGDPFQLPKLKFFGPDSKVGPLRERLCENAESWDREDPLLANLESLLGIEFPDKSNVSREDLKIDCWICYSYNLDGATPTTICRTERCSACFHDACAYEWLKSLPDSRTTLETIFGQCPYCKSPLSVKIPK